MGGDVQRHVSRYVHPSLERVGIAVEWNNQALDEPGYQAQRHGLRARPHHPLWDRRFCGDYLLGLSVGEIDVGELSHPGRRWLVESPQNVLTGAHSCEGGIETLPTT